MEERNSGIYRFGPFRLDTKRRALLRGDVAAPVPSNAYEVLVLLVQNSGRVLERNEILNSVWRGTIVEDANLTVCVSALRKALGDTPAGGSYIVTVPGRGYQFVASVQEEERDDVVIFARRTSSRVLIVDAVEDDELERGSLAVLPFRRLGLTPEDDYLGVALADALITSLSVL